LWIVLLLSLAACQAEPPPSPTPVLTPTVVTPRGTSTPFIQPTITPLPSYTLEPLLSFSAPDEFSAGPARLPTREETSSFSAFATNPPPPALSTSANTPIIPATQVTTPLPTEQRPYPLSYTINNISGHPQKYSLGCEAAAAVDWAAYFDVDIDEDEFQSLLPESDNPNKGFVGDVTGRWGQIPPNDYGVHAEPVADVLYFDYDVPAYAYIDYTLEEMKEAIAQDRPVLAWVIGNVTRGQAEEYEDEEGDFAVVARYEHVVIVTGYDDTAGTLRYMNNGRFYSVPQETFLDSWSVLENMVIVYEEDE